MNTKLLALLVIGCAVSVAWTIRNVWGHLTGRVGHLDARERTAYQWQLEGYKAERNGNIQGAVDAYAESLAADPTNRELAGRREYLIRVISGESLDGRS